VIINVCFKLYQAAVTTALHLTCRYKNLPVRPSGLSLGTLRKLTAGMEPTILNTFLWMTSSCIGKVHERPFSIWHVCF